MGERVVGSLLGMGLEGSWRGCSVDGLRRLPARADRSRLAGKTQRILCVAGIRAGDIHVAGCELHYSRASLLRGGITEASRAFSLFASGKRVSTDDNPLRGRAGRTHSVNWIRGFESVS